LAEFKSLMVRDDPDWIDLQLWVTHHETTEMEGEPWLRIGIAARHAGENLGFKLLYPLKWQAGAGGTRPHNLVAPIYIAEAKPYSDVFLRTLATLWRVDTPQRMAPITAVRAAYYGGDPERVLQEEIMLHAWVGEAATSDSPADPSKPYGEFHLVIDLPGGKVKLAEREPDYAPFRRAVVQALARGGA
jgi:hypothetical protein